MSSPTLPLTSADERTSAYVERVARHMFQRQAVAYGADATLIRMAWSDSDIRAFWLQEAASVLAYMEQLRR
jgi:hypothetical protein